MPILARALIYISEDGEKSGGIGCEWDCDVKKIAEQEVLPRALWIA
jgi:hypothetical protein